MAKSSAFGTQLNIGIRQEETATVLGAVTGDGDAEVIVTANGMTGSPITLAVAVLDGDTADTVAGKIRAALLLVANIVAKFDISGSGANVILIRKIAAANDNTVNVSIDNDTCTGLTTAAASANTRAGVVSVLTAKVQNIGGPGLGLDTEDVTTHDSVAAFEEVIPTILRSGEISLDLVYDPGDATHDASTGLISYIEGKIPVYCDMVFLSSYHWMFSAFVTGFEPEASHDGALKATAKLKISGSPILV